MILETKNLCFSRGVRQLCKNFSFQVQEGDCWGILGQNGCGKSTLLLALAGLYDQYHGDVLFKAQNIKTLSRRYMAQNMALMLQQDEWNFLSSVQDFVLHGRYAFQSTWSSYSEDDIALCHFALEKMDLLAFSDREVTTLSGGESRRLEFATLLVQDAQLLLLDEPVNHLDLQYQIKLLNYVNHLIKEENKTALVILHDVNLAARFCNKILFMDGKGSVQSGVVDEMLSEENLSLLYGHQVKKINHEGRNLFFSA